MSAGTHYFICSNTGNGIYSLCDEITKSEDTRFLYIIKGGPGCGKSSFMKRLGKIAEEKGLSAEYIHCSGDPDSLDGIILPEFGVAYMDGTAPHILEPDYPGVAARYLNMGEFYDFRALSDKKELVKAMSAEYKAYYAKAYKYLAAASQIGRDIYSPLISDKIVETILRRAGGICAREFTQMGKGGAVIRRFLSAFTCEGAISRYDTVKALCGRVCIIDNEFGLAPLMLRHILDCALKSGYKAVLCLSPLYPDRAEHLLIPELSLAFLSVTAETPYDGGSFKHVRLDALVDKEKYRENKHMLREEQKLYDSLLEKARQNLFLAKELHDRLEDVYNPHVNFDGVYKLSEKHAELYNKA